MTRISDGRLGSAGSYAENFADHKFCQFSFVCSCFVCVLPKTNNKLPQVNSPRAPRLRDTRTSSPTPDASHQQYKRYNLRHFDSPISSFVCFYPMRATLFVFV